MEINCFLFTNTQGKREYLRFGQGQIIRLIRVEPGIPGFWTRIGWISGNSPENFGQGLREGGTSIHGPGKRNLGLAFGLRPIIGVWKFFTFKFTKKNPFWKPRL